MHCQVVIAHHNIGHFPTFHRGTQVFDLVACEQYHGWLKATIDGHVCYVYEGFIDTVGRATYLNCDYNPTEADVAVGALVELIAIYQDWAWVVVDNHKGWLPCRCLRALAELTVCH